MNLPEFDLVRPDDLAHAAALVADEAVPYCGGTELLAAMGMGLLRPERLVTLRLLPQLSTVSVNRDRLRIGATVTHRDVSRLAAVTAGAPLLARVARRIGNVRVRATGTIGGNLAFGEPRSDVSTALGALDATVVAFGAAGGERRVPIREFVRGAFETALLPGELVVAVEVAVGGADVAIYRKVVFSERPVVAVAVARDAGSRAWRLVVGAVGDRPFHVELGDLSDADPAGIAGEIEMSTDLSGSESYKRHLTETTVRRAVGAARDEAAGAAA